MYLFDRMPKDGFNISSVRLENTDTLEILLVIEFPNPDAFITTTRGQEITGVGPRRTFHLTGMTLISIKQSTNITISGIICIFALETHQKPINNDIKIK